ncbi:hypothetical protein E3N88_40616 [Mikania micrantha]|uniref:Pentacotripeptide-repeat region of PRORP domain-containing protein n=1 Tax=Mikania micrantha TaxID=192012 RepID=A0A5N6LN79_9ASTR|nr:hypothetical protein E3N88_40616 [Mikania micrantha]
MPNPNMFSCKVMIRWYFISDLHSETIGFYKCLRKCLNEHDNVVFSIVVKACTETRDINEGRKVHCHIVKARSRDSFVLTNLVDMYAKCGDVISSWRVFDTIVDRDVVSWTSMIVAYVQNGCADEALVLFNRMRSGLIEGNQHTVGSIVCACAKLRALHQGKWVHGYAIKNRFDFNSHFVSSLVDMYMKCGAVLDAQSVFDDLSSFDLVSWTSMIVGYTQNGYPNQAIALFINKKHVDILPNSVAIASVISACAQLGYSQLGSMIHCQEVKQGLEDGNVVNALVDMAARRVFDGMGEKSIISWNALINAYGMQGDCSGSIEVFHNMVKENIYPTDATFTAILSTCSHTGTLEGWKIYDLMHKEFNLVPKMDHYGCLVDLLARSGRLEEAFNLIKNMRVQLDVSLLGSFLHGCSMHSRFDLGETAVKWMFDQHPVDVSYHVLVSNLYASDRRWSQVSQIRELMKLKDLSKLPGCTIKL